MPILLKAPPRIRVGLMLVPLLLAAVGTFSWLKLQNSQQQAKQAAQARQTALVVRQNITVKVSASGAIKPITPVNISPKQPGQVAKLYVDQGDQVKAGQILAEMDNSNLLGQAMQAQGRVAEAKANLRKLQAGNRPQEIQAAEQNLKEAQAEMIVVRSTYESNRSLYSQGAISRNTLDSSRSQHESTQARINALQKQLDLVRVGARPEEIDAAQAQVTQAEGALKTIQTQLNDTIIRAPFAGIVTQKYADVGAFVTPTTSASATSSATSSSILAIASDLEAIANVAETDIGKIYPKQPVELRVDAYPDRSFRGQVRLIAPESIVVQNVTSFQVRIQIIDDFQHQLKSGMNLTASFLVKKHQGALMIPTPAIVSQAEGTGVYVLKPNDTSEWRLVKIGATVGTQTQVSSGLAEGDRVFVTFPGQRQANRNPVTTSPLGMPGSGGRPAR
ncbi:MAG TPA: efflux RND transporter periplasmic adaptor subunit [Leptolyngbyaceae cyanobacterium M33_DOE_097]|uniref:Efflux RND transporter periplasmic adaptor subunit n=1 Tax=Oscillatoriales cyanobacterium SpSt-418 TaxID=2282169 RepID=A0A7C3PIS1_9CYAN|nr:efflux RND transporter periplasmic adaptor subunit [Leptolyngbyaceae cyanobacterium M33_DOE_097]